MISALIVFVLIVVSIVFFAWLLTVLIYMEIEPSEKFQKQEQQFIMPHNWYLNLKTYRPADESVLEADGIIFCDRAYGSHCLQCKYASVKEVNGEKVAYGCFAPDFDGKPMVGLRKDMQ